MNVTQFGRSAFGEDLDHGLVVFGHDQPHLWKALAPVEEDLYRVKSGGAESRGRYVLIGLLNQNISVGDLGVLDHLRIVLEALSNVVLEDWYLRLGGCMYH